MLLHAILILRQLDYVVPSSDNHDLTDAVRFVLNLMGFNLGTWLYVSVCIRVCLRACVYVCACVHSLA
jgi:hypothetical protein